MKYGEDLKKVQEIELDILKKVIKLCHEHNIDYFILGGTLLGAVRHNGFIPWDDDIDIGMTRENYNRFLDIANDNLDSDLFLQTFETDPETPFYFSKIRKKGTKFVEYYCRNLNINQGVFLDIFPFDNLPDEINLRERHIKTVKFWSFLYIAKSITGLSVPQKNFLGSLKLLIRTITHIILIPFPKKILYKKLNLTSQRYNGIPCEMKSFIKYKYLMVPSTDIENTKSINFEGIKVNCPNNYESYLKNQYGDFMTLPPVNERVGHRPYNLEVW